MKAVDIQILLESQQWKFAKTMPEIPHWYSLRKDWSRDDDFVLVAEYILSNGVTGKFQLRTYIYLFSGAFKYWIMEESVTQETILINRAEI
jgi:hypothetical protein